MTIANYLFTGHNKPEQDWTCSPLLELHEGDRVETLGPAFDNGDYLRGTVTKVFEENRPPRSRVPRSIWYWVVWDNGHGVGWYYRRDLRPL